MSSRGSCFLLHGLRWMGGRARAFDTFNTEMGWDLATGAPTRARLTALGMAHVADGLKALFPGSIWG